MINVSNDFKNTVKGNARTIVAYIDDGDSIRITDGDDLKNWSIKVNGNMFQTVLRQAEAKFWGGHDLRDKTVNIGLGVIIGYDEVEEEDIIEYIDYGTFRVVEQEENKDTQQSTVKMYDKMYESLRLYELYDVEYPMTLKEYVEAICGALGWTLGTSSFLNDDLVVSADLFAFQGFTYRDVLEQIAEITGTMIYFNTEDELVLVEIGESVVETLSQTVLRKLNTEAQWGGVNSVAFARTPVDQDFVWRGGYVSPPILLEDGDELLMEDGEELLLEILVEIEGLFQIRFENNLLVDSDREAYIDSISDEFTGFSLVPFDATTIFLGYLELGDKVKVQDRNAVEYESYITSVELQVGEGFKEVVSASIPPKSRSNFKRIAGVITGTVLKTEVGERNIRDGSVTSAKIREMSVDKLTTGTLKVGTEIIVPDDLGRALIYIANVEVEDD
jgi:hypothetical protein